MAALDASLWQTPAAVLKSPVARALRSSASDLVDPTRNRSTSFEYRSACFPARKLRSVATAVASTLESASQTGRRGRLRQAADRRDCRSSDAEAARNSSSVYGLLSRSSMPAVQTGFSVARGIVRGECDDRYAPRCALALPNQGGSRKAVHGRHAQIHQNQIEALGGAARNRLRAGLDPDGGAPQLGQIALRDRRVDGFILHQQHMAADVGCGRRRTRRLGAGRQAARRLRSTSASYSASRCTGLDTMALALTMRPRFGGFDLGLPTRRPPEPGVTSGRRPHTCADSPGNRPRPR